MCSLFIDWLKSLDPSVEWDCIHNDDLESVVRQTIEKNGYMNLDSIRAAFDDMEKLDEIWNILTGYCENL